MNGEATVRVGSVLAIPAVLRSLGADPAEVFAAAKVDPALFDDAENVMPYAARSRLISACVEKTGCRHFGLLLGQQGVLYSLGLVGYLAQHSPDVGTALRNLVRYLHIHVRGATPTLKVNGDLVHLGYEILQSRIEAVDQIQDGALALECNIMRTLCGADWKPIEVQFAHRKPGDLEPYRQFFRSRVQFDAAENALVFSASWLTHRLPSSDPQLLRLLQQQIDALKARHGEDFPEQVRRALRTALLTGHGKADQVAALFSMHSRTLNRRLSAGGTTFRELVDETCHVVARQMLEASAIGVTDIASTLGYADASSFTRAFRRWSGTTPARWRKESKQATPRKSEPAPRKSSRR